MAKESKKQLSDAQIIRRQLLIVGGILAVIGLGYLGFRIGEDSGWGNPDRAVKIKMEKANQAFMNRDLALAVEIYEKLIRKYPTHPQVSQAMTQLATAYEEKGDFAKAAETYQGLLKELDPSKADMKAYTLLQVGKLKRQMNDFPGALATFAEVRSFKPGSDWAGEALAETGRVWQDQKDYKKAFEVFRQLIKEMPGGFLAAEAQASIGACLEAQGKEKEAMKAYQVVLDKYPSAVWDQAKARIEYLKKRLEKKG